MIEIANSNLQIPLDPGFGPSPSPSPPSKGG